VGNVGEVDVLGSRYTAIRRYTPLSENLGENAKFMRSLALTVKSIQKGAQGAVHNVDIQCVIVIPESTTTATT
jgi:hypothetical protein